MRCLVRFCKAGSRVRRSGVAQCAIRSQTQLYAFFAHVLWPVYVPAAVWLIEPRGPRRKALLGVMATGPVLGAWLSSHRAIKVFGVLALLSSAAAYWLYANWFTSIWCFFAALLSALVYLPFLPRRLGPLTSLSARLALRHAPAVRPPGSD